MTEEKDIKRFYLREVVIPNPNITDHYVPESKLGLIELTDSERLADRDYWVKQGATRVLYFRLNEPLIGYGKLDSEKEIEV